jgi:hypothetical protein
MTYEELMREVVELRFHNGELKRRLETAEAALRAKGARGLHRNVVRLSSLPTRKKRALV